MEKGIESTEKVIRDWLADELCDDEVAVQKSESIGSQMVQYDAPGALASAIHYAKVKDGNVDMINKRRETIENVSLHDINEAKSKIKFENLCVVRVGTF